MTAYGAPVRTDTGSAVAVAVRDVTKTFGARSARVTALDALSLTVRSGEFVCLLGASGCGKSTLLSLVAGLDEPTTGAVDAGGRRIGFVFQEPALMPWLTAAANVALPLRLRGVTGRAARSRTDELLRLVHLDGAGDKRPHELSGGMRQRVAIARALAQDADLMLMDEPFAALDAMTRDRLHDEIERLWRETGVTVLFVTHNVREAVRLGDRVVLLSSRPGRVVEDYAVGLGRPRRIESAEVAALALSITDRLREEVRRHG